MVWDVNINKLTEEGINIELLIELVYILIEFYFYFNK